MSRFFLFIFLCFFIVSSYTQEMQGGFVYLETGKYAEAKRFFENVLKTNPENRTAKLCYGRAVGLIGDAEKAVVIFTELKQAYPGDFEIQLNYAESLLWNKQFSEAVSYYENLIQKDNTSFPAVLGYANALSNLKNYQEAFIQVNKALQLQNKNPNALISRKYIRLGCANELSQNKKYTEALALLDENLVDFPNDKDTQLNKANIYLVTDAFALAEKTYTALATHPKDSISSLNGLALIAHKKHREKKALTLATIATSKVENFKDDQNLYLSTQERYTQALLWNRKFMAARKQIDQLQLRYPDHEKVLALQAAYGMYTSRFKKSTESYHTILNKDQASFDGNLGIANAYRAVGKDWKSYTYAFKTLQWYPKQADAEKLVQTLKKTHTPFIEEKTVFTFDNGDNEAVSIHINTEIPHSTQLKTSLAYTYRTTKNTGTAMDATSHNAALGLQYRLHGKISILGNIGVTRADGFTNTYTSLIGSAILKTKPYRLQNLEVGYRRELQNFNADLLNREIIMNNYFLNYNMGTTINLGWYTQYMYTSQTDNNIRNLLFTSLYYTILHRPVFKTGINYQYISFTDQVPLLYFSPEQFHLGEIFAEVVSDPQKQWFYSASAALGQQFVEEDPNSATFRAESKLGYQFSNRFKAHIYGKYSNIASATAAGFEYVEFGFRLRWHFLKQPIFDKKIMLLMP